MLAGNCHLVPKPSHTLYGLRLLSPSKKKNSFPGAYTQHMLKRGLFTQRWMLGTGVHLPQAEPDRLLTRLMQGARAPKLGLCLH